MSVKCEDCSKTISDATEFCPRCGCPANEDGINWRQHRKMSGIVTVGSLGWYLFSVYMDKYNS